MGNQESLQKGDDTETGHGRAGRILIGMDGRTFQGEDNIAQRKVSWQKYMPIPGMACDSV